MKFHQLRNLGDFSDPGEARTLDPMIKSHLLYQLSYGVMRWFCFASAKIYLYFVNCNSLSKKNKNYFSNT